MPWSSRARSQRRLVAPAGCGASGTHLGVGGVDADVERAQPLGDDPLEVGLGEAGQGGEVPVEEAEPVVVVLEVEALPQPRRQLVDEAELAVVVARAHLVEQRRVDLDAERLAGGLGHLDGELEPAAADVEHQVGLVGQQPPLDDVPGGLAVEADDLVADEQTGPLGRRSGRDGDDAGCGHPARLWPCGVPTSYPRIRRRRPASGVKTWSVT